VHRFTSESGIPSFPRKRESNTGTGTPHLYFSSALGSRFRGNDAGERTVDVRAAAKPAL
jgi:hypothetical protein